MLAKGHLQFQEEYRKLLKGLELRQEASQAVAGPLSCYGSTCSLSAQCRREAGGTVDHGQTVPRSTAIVTRVLPEGRLVEFYIFAR